MLQAPNSARPGSGSKNGRSEASVSAGSWRRALVEGAPSQKPSPATYRERSNTNAGFRPQQPKGRNGGNNTYMTRGEGSFRPHHAGSAPIPSGRPQDFRGQRVGPLPPDNGGWKVVNNARQQQASAQRAPATNGAPFRQPQDVRVKDAQRRQQEDRFNHRSYPQHQEPRRQEPSSHPWSRAAPHGHDRPAPPSNGSNGSRVAPATGPQNARPQNPSDGISRQQGAQKPPAWLLEGDAESRRSARVPSMGNWIAWCDYEEEHPEEDFSYDHLAPWLQVGLAAIWAKDGKMKRWVSQGATLRPQYAALLA